MRTGLPLLLAPLPLLPLLLLAGGARAQAVFHQDEVLASDRPEAWAMRRAAATTLMTPFGADPLASGRWAFALDLGHVPQLDADERRVGFNGTKLEDLNKTSVFGRLRAWVGLPHGWQAELGYTPPLLVDGTRPRNLVAAAIGRDWDFDRFRLAARLVGQHGGVDGDITCPAELAGVDDPARNPFGCQAASDDRVSLDYYGTDLAAGWQAGRWRWHATGGVVRTELQVQVDALTFDVRDRSRLVANGWMRWIALGVRRELSPHWDLGAEVLYVPLQVQRPGEDSGNEPLTSVRVQLRFRPD